MSRERFGLSLQLIANKNRELLYSIVESFQNNETMHCHVLWLSHELGCHVLQLGHEFGTWDAWLRRGEMKHLCPFRVKLGGVLV